MKQYLTILKVLWVIWVWEPFVAAAKKFFEPRPCCDKPAPVWTEGSGITVMRCHNCGKTAVYTRAGF